MTNQSISQTELDKYELDAEISLRIEALGGICEAIYDKVERDTINEPLIALANAACFMARDLGRAYPY